MYNKGAAAERELAKMLVDRGFLVVRAAGSGVFSTAVDILAFRRYEQYAFECKARAADRLTLPRNQMAMLKEWKERTGITPYIAWKVPRKGWFFISLSEMEGQSITLERAMRIGRRIDGLV